MLTDGSGKTLEGGKYTDWAVNLTIEQLSAVLWLVGEYGYRAHHILRHLPGEDDPTWKSLPSARARYALEALARIVRQHERIDVNEVIDQVRRIRARLWEEQERAAKRMRKEGKPGVSGPD
jgi:hypothetical protein